MSSRKKIWIGADPGGKGNFGLAILKPNGSFDSWCLDCAEEAIELVEREKVKPFGVGVDAPLWWSSGQSSDRQADKWLRKEYGLSGGQVQAANSLRGAALVQGIMFVHRIKQTFPKVRVTETHPKALLKALKIVNCEDFSKKFSVNVPIQTEHERDAAISAVAAREGFEKRWKRDLSKDRGECEQDPSKFWLAPVHYFWPDT